MRWKQVAQPREARDVSNSGHPQRSRLCFSAGKLVVFAASATLGAQEVSTKPVVFTTQQDHQNMLEQLGVTKLRPGRSSNEKATNAANYDEAQANPYPNLPEILKLANGQPVQSTDQWYKLRRPEIVELLEREVYGRVPQNVPKVQWEVRESREIQAGGRTAVQKHIVGVVDNSACPRFRSTSLCH